MLTIDLTLASPKEIRHYLLVSLKEGTPYPTQERLQIFRDVIQHLQIKGKLLKFLRVKVADWGSLFIAAAHFERYSELQILLSALLSCRDTPKNTELVQQSLLRTHNGVNCLDILINQGLGYKTNSLIKMILEAYSHNDISELLLKKAEQRLLRYVFAILHNHSRFGQAAFMLLNLLNKNYASNLSQFGAADMDASAADISRAITVISSTPEQPEESAQETLARYLSQVDKRGYTLLDYFPKSAFPSLQVLREYGQESALQFKKRKGISHFEQAVKDLDPSRLVSCIEFGGAVHEQVFDPRKLVEQLAYEFNRLFRRYRNQENTIRKNRIGSQLKAAVSILEILSHTGMLLGRIFDDPKGNIDSMLVALTQDKSLEFIGNRALDNVFLYASCIGSKSSGFYFAGEGRKFLRFMRQFMGWYDPNPEEYPTENEGVIKRMMHIFRIWAQPTTAYHAALKRSFAHYMQDYFAGVDVEGSKVFGWRSNTIAEMQKLARLFYSGQSLQSLLHVVIPKGTILAAQQIPDDLKFNHTLPTRDSEVLERLSRDIQSLIREAKKRDLDSAFCTRLVFYLLSNAITISIIALWATLNSMVDPEYKVSNSVLLPFYVFLPLYISISSVLMGRHYRVRASGNTQFWTALEKGIEDIKEQYKRLPEEFRTPKQDRVLTLQMPEKRTFVEAEKTLGSTLKTLTFLKTKQAELAPEIAERDVVIQMPNI